MSRHRNMKHIIEDDYYDDDYYDDDYYDDYDDYDSTYVAPKPKPKQQSKPKQPTKSPVKKQPSAATPTKAAAKTPNGKGNNSSSKAEQPTLTVASPKATSTPTKAAETPQQQRSDGPSPPTPEILIQDQQESRQTPLTLVILGHVDAGKSSVMGHLLYHHPGNPTGQRRAGGSNVNYAWLLDEDENERAHGVTMDIATKSLRTASGRLLVIQDAPGHADYVPAAITGTALADAALLTVDVTDFATAFDAGQLREHALLARGLGVAHVLVVLNKMDLVEWKADWYESVRQRLVDFLVSSQCGFARSKVRCVPVSAVTGDNIFAAPTQAPWYTGPTLWKALDGFDATPQYRKLLEKPMRLLLSDVSSSSGTNVVVRAKVLQGWVQLNDPVVVWPYGDSTRLTKLQRFAATESSSSSKNNRSQYATAGELIDVVLAGIDATRLAPGQIVVRPHQKPPLARRCVAQIFLLPQTTNTVLIRGAQVTFHLQSLDVPCHLSQLVRILQPTLRERPRALAVKQTAVVAIVELTLQAPICMQTFADCRPLGRFVLRRGGDSVAVGRIEQVLL